MRLGLLLLIFLRMSAVTFDTYAYVKKLRAVGVPEEQAEVQAQAIADLVADRLVTKEDLERGLKDLEYRLIIRLGGMIVVAIGAIRHAGETLVSTCRRSLFVLPSG